MPLGIDYGLGRTNIDHATGIRYGCISQHSIMGEAFDDFEADYGKPTCPKCGNEARESTDDDHEHFTAYHPCGEYACETCQIVFPPEDAFGDDPLGWTLEDGEYTAESCLDSDIIITKSPYYTYAPFCSPCVPGAGNLDGTASVTVPAVRYADDRPWGVKTYCFAHDWFDGKAPYRVFRVIDDTEVLSNE